MSLIPKLGDMRFTIFYGGPHEHYDYNHKFSFSPLAVKVEKKIF